MKRPAGLEGVTGGARGGGRSNPQHLFAWAGSRDCRQALVPR